MGKYRVSGDVDVLLLAVGNQVVLSEERVTLDLVRGWNDTSCLDDTLKLVTY